MKRNSLFTLLLVLSILGFNCQKELSFQGDPGNSGNKIKATIQGNILDENGQPADGVSIQIGTATVITNAKGYFRITNVSVEENAALVKAEKPGYFKAYRVFTATKGVNQVVIKLIKKVSAGNFMAGSGGDVTLSNGTKISLPANGVMTASGAAYSGSVNIYASYIDPTRTDIIDLLPGSFLARDKDDKEVILTSYGMLAVELESNSGEKLQVATGSAATLTIPIPASAQASAPASIPMWYVDEQTGIWKEEGIANKTGSDYIAQVKHFTYWNCDIPGPTVNFTAKFVTSHGVPLVNTCIVIRPVGGFGNSAHGYTDSLGQVSGPIPANMNLVLEVIGACYNGIYSQNIGPFSSNINMGTITVPNGNPAIVTVKGKLVNCNNAPVTNGYAIIYYDNFTRYSNVNANGEFSTAFASCNTVPSNCQVIGVDLGAQQQGIAVTTVVTVPETNTGTIAACGTSTQQYINYSVDGNSYSISTAANDTMLLSSTVPSQPMLYQTFIYGHHMINGNIYFTFDNNGVPGPYPLNHLEVLNYNRIALIAPFDVSLTNFPQAGQFYEGNFSGQFRDSSDLVPIHTVNCSFRIRRN
jgi:hypothetical protein